MTDQVFDPLRDNDPRTAGGYRLRARVGAGGMGRVFLSFSPGGRPVAVKIVRSEYADDPAFRARFAQEISAAQQVNGIHIAQLLDADANGDPPWMASAYIPGPSLAEAVRLAGPLPVPVVAGVAVAIARALQAVHAAGIIHRDLKPNNVILGPDGPRVIDFGVAKATDGTNLTLSGRFVGTPQYMSPERVRGLSSTPASDVYALGAVMYHAATGLPPHGEGNDYDVALRVGQGPPPELPGCPPELRDVISACMAREPMDRPALEEVIARCTMPGLPLPPAIDQAVQTRQAAVAALAAEPEPTGGNAAESGAIGGGAVASGLTGGGIGQSGAIGGGAVGSGPAGGEATGPDPDGRGHTQDAVASDARTVPGTSPGRRRALIAAGAAALVLAGAGLGAWGTLALSEESRAPAQPAGSRPAALPSAPPSTVPPTVPSTVPSTAPATGTAPSSPSSEPTTPATEGTPEAAKVQWSGTVRFNGDGIDLDPVPPRVNPGRSIDEDVDEGLAAPSAVIGSASGMMAVWKETGEPSRDQCKELVLTQGNDRAGKLKKGDRVCVITGEERVALLEIRRFPEDFSGVVATVKVWELTEPE